MTLDRVEAALALIRQFDPVRYKRLRKDLNRIVVRLLFGSIGQFSRVNWSCELDSRYVLRESTTPEMIASLIVHEATHARLDRRGIGYPESLRQRIEDICVYQEWLFGDKLPNGAEVREKADRFLSAPAVDFSDEALRARGEAGAIAFFEDLGFSQKTAGRIIASLKWFASKVRAYRSRWLQIDRP